MATEFGEDEFAFMIISGAIGVLGLLRTAILLLRPRPIRTPDGIAALLFFTPIVALGALYYVLQHWADPHYVIGQPGYILLFMLGGAAWIVCTIYLVQLLGISLRDDALDRYNSAAAVTIAAAILGAMALYAGGNVGAGPTIWTTIGSAAAAAIVWLFGWIAMELFTPLADTITIDRDIATALRHGGFLLALGLILGRAVAGDFTSWQSTFNDFACHGWIALPMILAPGIMHRFFRPTPTRPRPSIVAAGLAPALVFLLFAALYLWWLGPAPIGQTNITYEQYTGHR
jgi:hypothetical protein